MQQGLVFNEYKFNSERGGMTSGGADCAMGKALPQKMGRKTGEYRRKKAFAKRRLFCRISGVPTGIRTPVIAVKGRCPRPLDDGDPDLLLFCWCPGEDSNFHALASART